MCMCVELGVSGDGTSGRDKAGVSLVAALPASQLQSEPQPQWNGRAVSEHG